MNEIVDPLAKRKRERQQPNRKWKEREVLLIIQYLHEEENFESPTAQYFYKKFLEKTNLDATWDLVRWKVRHLRAQFKKANDWLASTGAGVLEQDCRGSIEAKVFKMCPYYEQLKEVFGKRAISSVSQAASSSSSAVPFTRTSDSASTVSSTPRAARMSTPKSYQSQLAEIQKQRISLEIIRVEFEQQKFEREKEIEDRQFIIEEKKLELQIKKQESEEKWKEKELELKKLELEMKERLGKYEIDKKYKTNKFS